jgi:hypothetical protein
MKTSHPFTPRVDDHPADLPPRTTPPPRSALPSRYATPRLVVFGSLAELTHSGQNDPPADPIFAGSVLTS